MDKAMHSHKAQIYPPRKRSVQRIGRLTEAQTRDLKFRKAIAVSVKSIPHNTHWYCIRLPALKSLYVGSLLARKGFCILMAERKIKRRVNGYVKKERTRYENAMPGYMFIGVPPGLNAMFHLYRLSLIRGIIGQDNEPERFDPQSIAEYFDRLGCECALDMDASLTKDYWDVEIGQEALAMTGSYKGHRFHILDIKGRFAETTSYMFGQECRMQVPLASLVRV